MLGVFFLDLYAYSKKNTLSKLIQISLEEFVIKELIHESFTLCKSIVNKHHEIQLFKIYAF